MIGRTKILVNQLAKITPIGCVNETAGQTVEITSESGGSGLPFDLGYIFTIGSSLVGGSIFLVVVIFKAKFICHYIMVSNVIILCMLRESVSVCSCGDFR